MDLVITQRPLLNCILVTHSYHSANCNTDHSLVGSKGHLQSTWIHQSKQKGYQCINTAMASMSDLCECFTDSIDTALNDCHTCKAEDRWNHIHDAISNCAMDTFGKGEAEPRIVWRRYYWTRASDYSQGSRSHVLHSGKPEMMPSRLLDATPMNIGWTLSDYSTLCWLWQHCALYDGMKKVFGPSTTKMAPLRSTTSDIIIDWGKQMERWAEHYQELHPRESTFTESAVKSTCTLPILEELDVPPSVEELSKAINPLACGKAPGKDGIPPEFTKAGKQTALLHHLHKLLLQCWEEGTVPQDKHNSNIITL